MSPTLNGSSAIRHFKHSNAIEIRNRITFDFYTGLSHIDKLQLLTTVLQALLGIDCVKLCIGFMCTYCAHPYMELCCTTVYNRVCYTACLGTRLGGNACYARVSLPLYILPGGILHEGDGEDVPLSVTRLDHSVPGHSLSHRAQQRDDQRWSLMDHHQHWWVARQSGPGCMYPGL